MSAAAIEAGKGFVRIFTDLNPLNRGLKQVEETMKSFGSRISNVGSGIAGIGASVTAIGAGIVAPIAAATKVFADYGSEIKDASDRTGIASSVLSELGYAAEQSGTDLGTVEKSIAKMQKGISGAAGGSKSLAKGFSELGLNANYLATLAPQRQFEMVAEAVGKIQDPTERAAKAMQIFGKSGTQLLPLLSSDIEGLRQEARDLGISINDLDASNAEALGDSFSALAKTIRGIGLQVGAAIAVPLTNVLNVTAAIIAKATQWIQNNRGIVQTIAAIGVGLVVAGGIATGLGVAIMGVGATIAAIGSIAGAAAAAATAAFGAIASVVGFLLTPVGLVVAAIVGIGVYAAYTAVTATGAIGKLSEMFGSLGSTVTTAWGGIVAAVSTGDLETAGQIAFTALEVAWLTITTTIRQVWSDVSDFFVNIWLGAVESIVKAGAAIYFGIARYFDQLSNALVAGFDYAVTYIVGAIDGIQTAIAKAIITLQEFFGMFNKDESIQIQATLDQEAKRRAEARQKGLDQRANERGSGLAQRDQQRRSTADQFNTIVGEDFQRRKTKVENPGLVAAQKRLAELQATLSEKAATAQAKAAEAAGGEKTTQAQAAATSAIQESSGGSTGTFVSGVANAIAGGGVTPLEDLGKQQLEALNSIDSRLREASATED